MDLNQYVLDHKVLQAQNALGQALRNPETPEQTAERMRVAKQFGVLPDAAPGITEEQKAARKAAEVDWAAIRTRAPVLLNRMADPNFVNLIKDDLGNQTMAQSLIFQLAPAPSTQEPTGPWQKARNAGMRAALNWLIPTGDLAAANKELAKIEELENGLAAGKSAAELFGSEQDPTGEAGRQLFDATKGNRREELYRRIAESSQRAAWAKRLGMFFPASEAVNNFNSKKGFQESIDAFKESPLSIILETGVESFTQYAPTLAMMAATGQYGLGAQVVATGLGSFMTDRPASLDEYLSEEGIDFLDPAKTTEFFSSTANTTKIAGMENRADLHALGPTLLDASSVGVASKVLLTKAAKAAWNPGMQKLANVAVQMPVQGAMGGAGEALGQVLSDREISSWSAVIAEIAGEHFTAPIEVATAGTNALAWAHLEKLTAERTQAAAQALGEVQRRDQASQVAPEALAQMDDEAARKAGIKAVYLDAQDYVRLQINEKFGPVVPQQEVNALVISGGEVAIPFSKYKQIIAPKDSDGSIAAHLRFGMDGVSMRLADEQMQNVQEAMNAQSRRARALLPGTDAFKKDLSETGELIGKMLRATFSGDIRRVSAEEVRAIHTLMQTAVSVMARDVGMLPSEVWKRFGVTEFRTGEGPQGASGHFSPAERWLARWNAGNKTTLLHETGHLFLEMRIALAKELLDKQTEWTGIQRDFVESVNDTLKYLGVSGIKSWEAMTPEQRRKYHEAFSRSFEDYMRMGRYPVNRVKSAFRSFKNWLSIAYGVTDAINESIFSRWEREIFDALFMSRAQVREATIRGNLRAAFVSVEEAGLSPREQEEYNAYLEDVYEEAVEEHTRRCLRKAREIREAAAEESLAVELKKVKAQYGKDYDVTRRQIYADMGKTVYGRLMKMFIKGIPNGDKKPLKFRLYTKDLEAWGLSEDSINKLRRHKLASKRNQQRGMSLEQIASEVGYSSVEEMLNDMLENPNIDRVVDRELVKLLRKKYPGQVFTTTLERTAEASLFNKAMMKLLQYELRVMERMVGRQTRTETQAYEQIAYELVGEMRYEDIKPGFYAVSARRAAVRSREAFRKHDYRQAIFFKRQEIYQSAMAKACKEALMQRNAFGRKLRGFKGKKKSGWETSSLEILQRALVDMGYFTPDQVHLNPSDKPFIENLAEYCAFRFGEPEGVSKETNKADWIAAAISRAPFTVSTRLLAALSKKDHSFVQTPSGLREFVALVADLGQTARNENQIRIGKNKMEVGDLHQQGVANITSNAQARGRGIKDQTSKEGLLPRFKDAAMRFGLLHARIPQLIEAIEGQPNGPIMRAIYGTANESANREQDLKTSIVEKLTKLLEPVMKSTLKDLKMRTSETLKKAFEDAGIQVPNTAIAFSKSEVFFLLLNAGNEGNLQRVLAGFTVPTSRTQGHAITQEQLFGIFAEYLTEEDFKAAQAVWNLFGELQAETGKVAKRLVGREPVWVQPMSFKSKTSDGKEVEMQGGYYPIVYDYKAVGAEDSSQAPASPDDMKPLTVNDGVNADHLKERSKAPRKPRPIDMTSRGMFEGLEQQIHYIAWAEWSNDMRKIFSYNDGIAQAITQYWGSEYLRTIKRWIAAMRNGNARQASVTDMIAYALRQNISLAGLGFNLVTAMVQPLGMMQSVVKIGGRWCGRGIINFLSMGPTNAAAYVSKLSPFMADRARTQFRELAEVHARITGTPDAIDTLRRWAYKPIVMAQLSVDIPTWLGAYEKAQTEGHSVEEAIELADAAVRDAQGSGRAIDLSTIERDNAWAKLFTVFYTFFNTTLNLAMLSGKTKSKMRAAGDMMILLALQPAIETFLRAALDDLGQGDDEPDWDKLLVKAGTGIVDFNLGLFVGLREMQGIFGEYKNYSGPAGLRKITDIRRLLEELQKDEYDMQTVYSAISALGATCGLPAAAVNRFIRESKNLSEGKTDNPLALLIGT